MERQPPGRHLVQHDAERPDVAARVRALAKEHFRRNVGQRSREHSGLHHIDRLRRAIDDAAAGAARQPEVEDLGAAGPADGDVGGLQIAMDHAALVCVAQRRGDLLAVANGGLGGEAILRDQFGEGSPFDELHRDERAPADLADLVDRADVRMIQMRSRARFRQQTLAFVRGRSPPIAADQFERDDPLQAFVMGPIDHAHATASQACIDPVLAEGLTDHFEW